MHTQIPIKRCTTHNSKTSGSKVFVYDLTSGHFGFMQITRVAHQSCRLGSQAEFVLGPEEFKSSKTFIGSLIKTCDWTRS